MKGSVYQRVRRGHTASSAPERNPATSKYTISKGGYPTKKKARKACRETMRQADWGRVMNRPGFDAHHILSGLKVRVMPSKYDSELRSKAVRLVVEHRDDYPGEFGALAAAGFPDSDPQDAEYFLLFDTAYGRVSSRALPLLKFSDEPADDFTVDGISVDDEPHGSSYVAPSNFFDRLFARTDSGG